MSKREAVTVINGSALHGMRGVITDVITETDDGMPRKLNKYQVFIFGRGNAFRFYPWEIKRWG